MTNAAMDSSTGKMTDQRNIVKVVGSDAGLALGSDSSVGRGLRLSAIQPDL